MIPPVGKEISDIERLFQSMIESGHSFEVWMPFECYEAAAILMKLLEDEKAALMIEPKSDHSSTNPA